MSTAEDSVFTKIVKGELPSFKVYEDDKTLAFLDIHPVQPGMTVIVTRAQVDNFEDLPEDDYTALFATVRKVAKRMKEVFPGKAKIAVQVEGLDVTHAHVKLFPINTGEEFRSVADVSQEPDFPALEAMAQKLYFKEDA